MSNAVDLPERAHSVATESAAPQDLAAASALLRAGVAERRTVHFAGNATKAEWGGKLDPVDLELSTAGLNQLISHRPGDMTAAVQAGLPLAQLQAVLAEHGQWLALDPVSEAGGATIGGLLATGDAGPRRLRYGTMRDLAIGATLILADGTVAHSGSHVIKNVAGYDLTKLFHRSLGSFGLIAEVIVRLHPRPPATATVIADATVAQTAAAAGALVGCGVEPAAVEWIKSTDGGSVGTLIVQLDGSVAGVAAATGRIGALLSGLAMTPDVVSGADAEHVWTRVTDARRGADDASVVRAGTLPTRLPDLVDELARLGDQNGVRVTVVSSAALGSHTAVLSGPPRAQAAVITAWRAKVAALGGALMVHERPEQVEAELDALGPPPPSVAILRAVKAQLDPDGRCAPGRFRGWF